MKHHIQQMMMEDTSCSSSSISKQIELQTNSSGSTLAIASANNDNNSTVEDNYHDNYGNNGRETWDDYDKERAVSDTI